MLSEFMRKKAGATAESNDKVIELQAYSQIRHLDTNGMYREPGSPFVYDLATRGLFAVLLHEGYQGKIQRCMAEGFGALCNTDTGNDFPQITIDQMAPARESLQNKYSFLTKNNLFHCSQDLL